MRNELNSGHVCLNGEEYTAKDIRSHIGYVPRNDSFLEYQTIREMLKFTAKMSYPDWMGETELNGRVDIVLSQLGLFNIQVYKLLIIEYINKRFRIY